MITLGATCECLYGVDELKDEVEQFVDAVERLKLEIARRVMRDE